MSTSYKEDCENYKNAKYAPELGETDTPHRKVKPKKKRKRSNHKHVYETIIIHTIYKDTDLQSIGYGDFCQVCGRMDDYHYLWNDPENRIEQIRKDNPGIKEVYTEWSPWDSDSLPIHLLGN